MLKSDLDILYKTSEFSTEKFTIVISDIKKGQIIKIENDNITLKIQEKSIIEAINS